MTVPSPRSPTVSLAVDDEALGGFRLVLRNLATTIEANLAGTVADTDPELLHELRVAVRRTRSVLAQGKGVLPTAVRDEYRERFGWLGQVTGAARDLDVHVLGWDEYVAPLSAVDRRALDRVLLEVEARRRRAHTELARVLQRDSTRELLDAWSGWLDDPGVLPTTPQPIGPFVARRIAKAQERVLRDGRSIDPTSPAERLHALRKDTKKLRYLLECFGGLCRAKRLKGFVDQLKALQDNLGEHQDAEVHLGQLRELAHDLHHRAAVDTDALLAMGSLADHLDRRRQQQRDEFALRFSAYDTPANHQALDSLLRPLRR
jgi:CHAD domain-containing protein